MTDIERRLQAIGATGIMDIALLKQIIIMRQQ